MKNISKSFRQLRSSPMVLALALAVGVWPGAAASVVSISPSSARVAVGASFDISLSITGLTRAANDSLSSFDLDLLYDATQLRLAGVHFSDATGANQLDFTEAGGFGFFGAADALAGRIDLFGLSGNSAAVLDASQDGAFQFAWLTFEALTPTARSTVAIDLADANLLFTDSGAGLLGPTFGNTVAHIEIGAVSAVPEPSALLFWLLGALPFVVAWRRRTLCLPAATGVLLGLAAAASAHAAPTAAAPKTAAAQETAAQQETISGVVTAVVGQRLQVRVINGSSGSGQRWFTTAAPLSPSDVGKHVSATASAVGDSVLLVQPSFSN